MSTLQETSIKAWYGLAERLELDEPRTQETADYLSLQYSLPGRYYHTLKHLNDMLSDFHHYEEHFRDKETVLLALLFHDAVYSVARKDNEPLSALAMYDMLSGAVDAEILKKAAAIIQATATHEATADPDTNLLLDIDMAVLATPWDEYLKYAEGVMKEYRTLFDLPTYRQGRIGLFLKPAITKGKVYITPHYADNDRLAIDNLSREIKWLESL